MGVLQIYEKTLLMSVSIVQRIVKTVKFVYGGKGYDLDSNLYLNCILYNSLCLLFLFKMEKHRLRSFIFLGILMAFHCCLWYSHNDINSPT